MAEKNYGLASVYAGVREEEVVNSCHDTNPVQSTQEQGFDVSLSYTVNRCILLNLL